MSYTVIFYICLYVYDMFHILLSCDGLRDLWNVCTYVCMHLNFVFKYYVMRIKSARL